jgi:hypothetical protein
MRWIVLTALALALILWLLFVAIGSMLARKRAGRKKASKPAAPAPKTHDPDHHPKGDDHDHGGHGHHKEPLSKQVLVWLWVAIVLVVLLLGITYLGKQWGFGQTPGLSKPDRAALAPQGTLPDGASPVAQASPACPATPPGWYDVDAPSRDSDKRSKLLKTPYCHHIFVCDRERDPECVATDLSVARFNAECVYEPDVVDPELVREREKYSTTCTLQSNTSEDLKLQYKYVSDNSR